MKAKKRRRVFWKLLLFLILLTAVLLIDSNFRIVTTEYEVFYKTLPASFDGFRIVALSDIHAAQFGEGNEKLISKIKAAKPDIIAILGDFIDSYADKVPMAQQLEIAAVLTEGLAQIAPVYYITGNHEWDSSGLWQLIDILKERGVTVMRNDYVRLEKGGESIVIAGRDDPNGPADMISREDFADKIYGTEGSSFIVLLEHRNYFLDRNAALGFDLVLCGHGHGGLVRLPFTDGLIGPSREFFPTYTNGIYEQGGTKMVVSRGIGNHTGFPRFLNNPHIVVAVLKKQ